MSKPINVLFVSHAPGFGGAERCLLSLLESLDRQRFNPIVAVPGPGKMSEWLSERKIEVRHISLRWWLGIRDASPGRRLLFVQNLKERVDALGRVIETDKIDVVFSNSLVALEGPLAARLTCRPHVWHVLEMLQRDEDLIPLFPMELFHEFLDQVTDRVAVVAECVAEELRAHVAAGKISIIHTGIRTPEIRADKSRKRELFQAAEDTLVVSYVGLLSKRKGVLTLAGAAKDVLVQVPNARFAIVGGEGGVGKELQRLIRSENLDQSVRLMGYRRDSLDIIANSDVFVLPSVADPLPVAVLEAMSLGSPVVATRSGGCSEMVEDGVTGFLVPSGDAKAMAAAITKMLQDPAAARKMGAAGRSRFLKHFRIEDYAARFEQVLTELAGKTPANATQQVVAPILKRINDAIAAECAGPLPHVASFGIRLRERLSAGPIGAHYRSGKKWLGRV